MHVQELIDLTREYIDEPAADASDWTDANLLSFINAEHRKLFSQVRSIRKDWFGRTYVFAPYVDTWDYPLPEDCVNIRRVQLLDGGVSVSIGWPVVNESTTKEYEIYEKDLNDTDSTTINLTSNRLYTDDGFYLFGNNIRFGKGMNFNGLTHFIRLWYTPSAPSLHTGTVASATSLSLTPDLTATLGELKLLHNHYADMYIYITGGTGAGQKRAIYHWDENTGVFWFHNEQAWTTVPDSSSTYSIVSPIKSDFHELLALGAAIRAKGIKTEDDTSLIGTMYGTLQEELKKSLEPRIEVSSRRVRSRRGGY